jgi:hypothetical protein
MSGHARGPRFAVVRQFVTAQWKRLLDEAHRSRPCDRKPANKRVRIGLYGYDETMPASAPDETNGRGKQ